MQPSWYIARRYLFSKKSHNAINVVSGVSAAAVAVVTAAMLCVMSVLNGFEGLIESMFSRFDADIRIEAAEGKSFDTGNDAFAQVRSLPYGKQRLPGSFSLAPCSKEVLHLRFCCLEQGLPNLRSGLHLQIL